MSETTIGHCEERAERGHREAKPRDRASDAAISERYESVRSPGSPRAVSDRARDDSAGTEPSRDDGHKATALTRRTALLSGAGAAAAALAPGILGRRLDAASDEPAPSYRERRTGTGEYPWIHMERTSLRLGEAGRDYTPVVTPDGTTLHHEIVDGVKVFHLVASEFDHELAEGLTVRAWGYNERVPGPTVELVAGDRVRFYVTNHLPAPTTVHWHGVILPCGMDGVTGLTQPVIAPGETGVYEFTFAHPGTYMYHPHFDGMTEEGLGMTGMIVVHPRGGRRPDRDYCIMLHEWEVRGGTRRPDPTEMSDFNLLTMNGRAFPDTTPLVAERGELVRIRFGNLSQMSHHPIHLHGYSFWVVATDGGEIPPSAQWPETTVLVPVGSTRTIELVADNPGDWLMHCHMTHHTMNQMGHGLPNMIGVDADRVTEKIRTLLPGYMTMGETGMGEMARHRMPVPENSIPMRGFSGQFGPSIMGGMATVLKVRDHAPAQEEPGWYDFPEGTVARTATDEELAADGIDVPEMPKQTRDSLASERRTRRTISSEEPRS